MSDGWEEINVPRGAYIGWGEKPGQKVIGEVLEYGPDLGTDFDGKKCPQVSLVLHDKAFSHSKESGWTEFPAGELVVINCGQASLKRAVQAAQLNPGDLTMIEMSGQENIKGGKTVKVFKIKVKRGTGELSANAQSAMKKQADKEAEQSPNGSGSDPWGTPAGVSAGGGGFPGADDEPPF